MVHFLNQTAQQYVIVFGLAYAKEEMVVLVHIIIISMKKGRSSLYFVVWFDNHKYKKVL